MDTPYGKPSGEVTIGQLAGKRVVFLPRHGAKHTIPPHKVPYKANLWAIRSLGVSHVVATCVVGSLKEEIRPGDFVTPDQFINFTWGRDDTHDVDREVVHLPMAEPYCSHLRNELCEALSALSVTRHERGTIVVIQGPRFSTIAESKMYALLGGDIVNMTQYPECYFARELGLCYLAVASVTDYDVGVESSISMRPGSMYQVLKIFHRNTALTQELLARFVSNVTTLTACECAKERLDEYYKARK